MASGGRALTAGVTQALPEHIGQHAAALLARAGGARSVMLRWTDAAGVAADAAGPDGSNTPATLDGDSVRRELMFFDRVVGVADMHGAAAPSLASPTFGAQLREVAATIAFLSAMPANGHTGAVLIADDDEQIRALVGIVLRRRGLRTVDVDNGLAAYEAARAEAFALLLVDWHMPVLDGPGCVARLQADPLTRSLPVVMLTGQSQAADKLAALEAGAHDFIAKPFDNRELARRVAHYVRWHALLTAATAEPLVAPANIAAALSGTLQAAGGAFEGEWSAARFLQEAQSSDARKHFARAAVAYARAAADLPAARAALAQTLLRLAGSAFVALLESTLDADVQLAACADAARCFAAAGNYQGAGR